MNIFKSCTDFENFGSVADTSIVNTVCLGFFEECGRLFHHRDTEFVAGGDIIDRGSTVSKSNK